MARYTWDPFEELRRMQSRMSRIFGESPETLLPAEAMPEVHVPFVDVLEKGNDIIVTADLPGVDKKDIKIDVRDNMLEISADKRRRKSKRKRSSTGTSAVLAAFIARSACPLQWMKARRKRHSTTASSRSRYR